MNCMDTNDQPCTQEDRDRIRAAALARAKQMDGIAGELEAFAGYGGDSRYVRDLVLAAAAQLRQLAES